MLWFRAQCVAHISFGFSFTWLQAIHFCTAFLPHLLLPSYVYFTVLNFLQAMESFCVIVWHSGPTAWGYASGEDSMCVPVEVLHVRKYVCSSGVMPLGSTGVSSQLNCNTCCWFSVKHESNNQTHQQKVNILWVCVVLPSAAVSTWISAAGQSSPSDSGYL